MGALQNFWDWVLFGVAVFLGLLVLFTLLAMVVSLFTRYTKVTFGAVVPRLAFIVVGGLLSYWLLFVHLGIV